MAINFTYEVALWVAERNFFQEFFNNKKVRLHATAPALDLHVKAYLKSIIKTIIVLPIIILSKTNPLPKKETRMSICSTRRRTLIPWPDESLNHSMQNIPSRCYGNGFTTEFHRVCWSPSLIYGKFVQNVSRNNCPSVCKHCESFPGGKTMSKINNRDTRESELGEQRLLNKFYVWCQCLDSLLQSSP